MQIIVNGRTIRLYPAIGTIAYEDLVRIAYEVAPPNPMVMYRYGEGPRRVEGTLTPGLSLHPADGMVVNVADTSNA
jgi:hypothetical protein